MVLVLFVELILMGQDYRHKALHKSCNNKFQYFDAFHLDLSTEPDDSNYQCVSY